MKLLVALGGNALLQRKQVQSAANLLHNVRVAADQLARVALDHQLIVTHGNGPQIGLLALQAAAYTAVPSYPLDMLSAESQGLIGYLLEQEIANRLPAERTVATLLTRVEVDPLDAAFLAPTKPIGPVYACGVAESLAKQAGWTLAADGDGMRRTVPSPLPLRILNLEPIRQLLDRQVLVIAAGGGGIPVIRTAEGCLQGVEAVIDKDLCSGLLAQALAVDCLIIATDVDAVYLNWGEPSQHIVHHIDPASLAVHAFQAGTMAPKVKAASDFALQSGKPCLIGSLVHIEAMLAGKAGTRVACAPPYRGEA